MKTGWLLGGVAVLLVLVAGGWLALRGGGATASGPVTLFQWQDYMDAPFLKDYEAATGEKPAITIFADEDEAFAKMRAGFKPDVMGPCYYEFPRWKDAGLLRPIPVGRLKNWNKISPTLRNLPGIAAGPGQVWFVPHYWGNTSLTIRTDLAPEYAKSQSWEILFDPKYKGRVSVLDGVDDVVPFIAKMIGVDAYNMSEADWRKVQAKLKDLVPQLRFVSSDDTALAQGLASGELVAAMSWRTTFAALRRENRPVAYLEPPAGDARRHRERGQGAGADRFGAQRRGLGLYGGAYRRRTRQHRGDETGARFGVRDAADSPRPGDLPQTRHLPAPPEGQGQADRRLDGDQIWNSMTPSGFSFRSAPKEVAFAR